jgi:hypothetical protein
MASCERCGHTLPTDARFCDHCGSRHTITVAAVRENPMESPAVRALLQRADSLRSDGELGAALDLVQEAAEQVGDSPEWARLEYSVRASIARAAVQAGDVADPLPGMRYEPMTPLARIEAELEAGPVINPALLAFVADGELVRIPSGVFTARKGRGPVMGPLSDLVRRGDARTFPLPDLRPTLVQCERQGGRVWVAGRRKTGQGHVLFHHEPTSGWTEVLANDTAITHLARCAQGRRLVVGTADGQVLLLDIDAGRASRLGGRYLSRAPVLRCGVAADSDLAFAWTGRGQPVLVGPIVSSGELRRLDVPHHDVTDVCAAGGGRLVATIDEVGQLCFFRLDGGKLVGQAHLPVLADPQLYIGGADPSHELAVVRPGGATLHCYTFRYLVFVGEPVHVVRTKPEKLPDGGRIDLGPFADFVVHYDGGRTAVFASNMAPLKG